MKNIFKIFKNIIFSFYSSNYHELENTISYSFKNRDLLEKVFKHKSLDLKENYENLEYLGDAVINLSVANWLLSQNEDQNEGFLSSERSFLTNGKVLAKTGKKLNLINYLKASKSLQINNKKVKSNIKENLYEALIGAIFLDSTFKIADKVVINTLIKNNYSNKDKFDNYKGKLFEYCQKNNITKPTFYIKETHGPDHDKIFIIETTIKEKTYVSESYTKKQAEQKISKKILTDLDIN